MKKIAVSIVEAGQTIGIGRTKIYELINDGTLETFKIGRRRLVKTKSIRAVVNND